MKALIRHFGVAWETGSRCLICRSSALWDIGEDAFLTVANKRQLTVFHGIGSDFKIQRKKSKLFFTDALNACNMCIRMHCTLHRAVTELSDISMEGFYMYSKQYYFQGFR